MRIVAKLSDFHEHIRLIDVVKDYASNPLENYRVPCMRNYSIKPPLKRSKTSLPSNLAIADPTLNISTFSLIKFIYFLFLFLTNKF